METKHTKGEWVAYIGGDDMPISIQVRGDRGKLNVWEPNKDIVVFENTPLISPEESLANAKLIAAAPDLLEALVQCKKALEVISSFGATSPIIERAEKAIKKAIGNKAITDRQ